MRNRKKIEKIPAMRPDKPIQDPFLNQVTVQQWEQYLILDLWQKGGWIYRHVVDIDTGEYASFTMTHDWTAENLRNAFGDIWCRLNEKSFRMSKKDKNLVCTALKAPWSIKCVYERIESLEQEYALEKREWKEIRRTQRIHELMESIPNPPLQAYKWIEQAVTGTLHYAFYRKDQKKYHCTSCQGDFTEKESGARLKHKAQTICPLCGHELMVDKRHDAISVETRLTIIHDVDDRQGIERHFTVEIRWEERKTVSLREKIRCFLSRTSRSKTGYKIYYADGCEWERRNPRGLRWKICYLYPYAEGIREGLAGTDYAVWTEVFSQMAVQGIMANYNSLLADTDENFVRMVEYLFKGRFYRLLEETSEQVNSTYGYGDYNHLNQYGVSIEEVMYLYDRQKINRLRQEDGGIDMLEWLRWSEKTGKKISSEALAWLEKNRIHGTRYCRQGRAGALDYLTPEKLMHYIDRQRDEMPGKRKTARAVLDTYEDYLSMAKSLGKDMMDEMVYRPRELKRRHDELVGEYEKYLEAEKIKSDQEKAREEADRMAQKYPGSEEILEEIRSKYEYEGEQYKILVPHNFLEVTMEGMALHHCVGHTERYFDRILQRETYICFLRRKEAPEEPFYTIEVEPGGTIRQHRGMYDEEPGIEEIKPFLREWQKEIRRRMKDQDHEYAQISAGKREQNLEELRQKNNTRVLEMLMEDLMEVV